MEGDKESAIIVMTYEMTENNDRASHHSAVHGSAGNGSVCGAR